MQRQAKAQLNKAGVERNNEKDLVGDASGDGGKSSSSLDTKAKVEKKGEKEAKEQKDEKQEPLLSGGGGGDSDSGSSMAE